MIKRKEYYFKFSGREYYGYVVQYLYQYIFMSDFGSKYGRRLFVQSNFKKWKSVHREYVKAERVYL